ncbi:uncharacterized protein CXorf65 homolog isoform X1 [Scyliorhinus canicula]|uniref:uncharacterized protein CXorf65 homolog isoform X1 n=1 Tax=Scyliorhinus canicula TaxID=7830 RepID=UPI0018F3BDFB|nr:uncharacterized protein CXorf65 homolog isoform X1 [Scyliorhinus canicula]XP_038631930.1 uncharacterized protein CXorf65 homolog isoform X1 [Scyliorhinus canicula]XP_038631931.1 uncharacterized protein CXorf65 homolog isoform X1 [Scyliorhinus canicula]
MFIYIKYGDDQHFLANPNCSLIIFRNYLQEKLNIQHPDTVDLYDDQMNMKLLFRMKDQNENLESLFEPRGTYYACKIERNEEDNSFKSVVPLDNNAKAESIDALQIQCVTLEHPKQKRVTRKMSLIPQTKKGKGTARVTVDETSVTSSGKSRPESGKKYGRGGR